MQEKIEEFNLVNKENRKAEREIQELSKKLEEMIEKYDNLHRKSVNAQRMVRYYQQKLKYANCQASHSKTKTDQDTSHEDTMEVTCKAQLQLSAAEETIMPLEEQVAELVEVVKDDAVVT